MNALIDRIDRPLRLINRFSHAIAAAWLFAIALLIFADVFVRNVAGEPFSGTAEIVANSIVSIVFLQLSQAIRSGGMLRAEILDVYLHEATIARLQGLGNLLGTLLFVAVAYSAWRPMVEAWAIGEFAGNVSTIRIPLYPIRTLLVVMSLLAALNFLVVGWRQLAGRDKVTGAAA